MRKTSNNNNMTAVTFKMNQVYPNTQPNNALKYGKENVNLMELTSVHTTKKNGAMKIQNRLRDLKRLSFTKRSSYNKKEVLAGKNNHASDKVTNLWTKLSLSSTSFSSATSINNKEKKSVSFSDKKSTRQIHNFPDDNIEDYWFTPEEIETTKWEYQFLLYFQERDESEYIDEDHNSTRGLEYLTEKGTQQLAQNRRCAYDAVLNEQKRQRMQGVDNDPLTIAKLYQECNQKFVQNALETAKEDELAVQEYLSDTPSYYR